MKIGDLVWSKKVEDDEVSSTRYWPGLVQRITDSHSVLVSFFGRQNPASFRPSDLRPFADDFSRSLSPPGLHRDHDEMLDSGLQWLCRRTALSLRCRCLFRSETALLANQVTAAAEEKAAFVGEAVVEFVRSKAVLPWVEVGDFVEAVKSVARVQAFRDYNAIGQRSAYRKRRRESERDMCSVESQPYLLPDIMVKEQLNFDRTLKMNVTVNAPIRTNPKICLLSKDSYQSSEICGRIGPFVERPLRSSSEAELCEEQTVGTMLVNLRYIAFDSSCLGANHFNATVKTFLSLRTRLFEKKAPGEYIRKCSPLKNRDSSYFSHPGCVEGNENTPGSAVFDAIVRYIERPVRRLELKKRFTLPDVSGPAFELHKTVPFLSVNQACYYPLINKTEAEEGFSCSQWSYNGVESILEMVETSGKKVSIGPRMLTSACNDVPDFSSNMPDLLTNNAEVSGGDREFIEKEMGMSCVKLQDSGDFVSNINRDIEEAEFENRNEDMQSDSNEANSSSGVKVEDIELIEVHVPEFRPVPNQAHVRHSNKASKNRLKGSEKLNKVDPGTPGLFSDSNEAQLSNLASEFSGSRSLHMKFSREVNLPSMEELVRRFSQFGPIDSSKTKIYWYTGSAKVVFFKQLDAVTAYQYARKKKVLSSQPDVRYWLNRFEGTRGGAKSSTVKPVPGLRSCLRNANSPERKDKAKRKVRFLMES